MYAKELMLDVWECEESLFTERNAEIFLRLLCDKIGQVMKGSYFYNDNGVHAIQMLEKGSITIHMIPHNKSAYINVFSCDEFSKLTVALFAEEFLQGVVSQQTMVKRK